jgi:hypothetical protein
MDGHGHDLVAKELVYVTGGLAAKD